MQIEKENMGRQCSIVCLIFQRLCDDYQCGGAPSGYLKSFVLPFLFFFFSFLFFSLFSFLFFSFLYFLFCLSLGGPFSSGATGHCPSMPPSRYATEYRLFFQPESIPGHTQKDHLNTHPEAELNKVTKRRQSLGQYVWTSLCNHCATPHATTGFAARREVSATHFHNCKQVCKP